MTSEDYGKINLANYFVKKTDLVNATIRQDGLMSKEDKIKLDNLQNIEVNINWSDINDVPLTFEPSPHTHNKSDITDFNHSHGDIDENGVISNGNSGDILILGVGNRITSSASIDASKIQNLKTINNESIVGTGNITITGGSNITVDSALSSISENPVQNQAIYSALENKANNTVATSSANGLMSTTDKNKLDGMSTVSFTINYTDGTSETLTLYKQNTS